MSLSAASLPLQYRKMNGLGNEIVVVDLRGSTRVLSADEARAVAADPLSRFDQMMVLHDPKTRGTEAYIRIYNTDGSEAQACGNGMRCVGWLACQGRGASVSSSRRGRGCSTSRSPTAAHHRRHGRSRASPGTRSRWPSRSTIRGASSCRSARSTTRSCIRRRWSTSAIRTHFLGRRCRRL